MRSNVLRASSAILALASMLAAAPARAGDGRIELNQACALAGCGPSDSPGFPIVLSTLGSYVLTSDLVVPDANTTAIANTPQGAVIDLNGFAIRGPTSCTGAPATCTGAGTGVGIGILGAGVVIKNGTIRGMGSHGISADDAVRVEDMSIESNGGVGVKATFGSQAFVVLRSRIERNGSHGIDLNSGSPKANLIQSNTIFGNGGTGVNSPGGLLSDNVIDSNASYGFNANIGAGLTAYGGNAFFNNNGGNANTQVLAGHSLGGNYCGDATC